MRMSERNDGGLVEIGPADLQPDPKTVVCEPAGHGNSRQPENIEKSSRIDEGACRTSIPGPRRGDDQTSGSSPHRRNQKVRP
jgi:hypothetical protein